MDELLGNGKAGEETDLVTLFSQYRQNVRRKHAEERSSRGSLSGPLSSRRMTAPVMSTSNLFSSTSSTRSDALGAVEDNASFSDDAHPVTPVHRGAASMVSSASTASVTSTTDGGTAGANNDPLVQSLETKILGLENSLARAQDELQMVKARAEAAELEWADQRIASSKEYEESRAMCSNLRLEVQRLQQALQAAEDRVGEAQGNQLSVVGTDDLASENSKLRVELETLRAELGDLQIRHKETVVQLDDMSARALAAENRVEDLEQTIKEFEEEKVVLGGTPDDSSSDHGDEEEDTFDAGEAIPTVPAVRKRRGTGFVTNLNPSAFTPPVNAQASAASTPPSATITEEPEPDLEPEPEPEPEPLSPAPSYLRHPKHRLSIVAEVDEENLGDVQSPRTVAATKAAPQPEELHSPRPPSDAYLRRRRVSISAEPVSATLAATSAKPTLIPKTVGQRARILNATSGNFLFSDLESDALEDMVGAMAEKRFDKGDVVLRQGEDGDYFYVIDGGEVDIYVKKPRDSGDPDYDHAAYGNKVRSLGPGESFGELALMYHAPRAATAICRSDVTLWAMDRVSFRRILMDSMGAKRRTYESFLEGCDLLCTLTREERSKLADVLEREEFPKGNYIVHEGAEGDCFFVLEKGVCVAERHGEELKRYTSGAIFGERALLTNEPRAADVVATTDCVVLRMDRTCFDMLLGSTEELLKRNLKEYNRAMERLGVTDPTKRSSRRRRKSDKDQDAYSATADSSEGHTTTASPALEDLSGRSSFDQPGDAEKRPSAGYLRRRRVSVSAEPVSAMRSQSERLRVVPKTEAQVARIWNTTKGNILFQPLDSEQMTKVVDCMFEVKVENGQEIIRQGEDGDNFYVIDEGQFDIFVSRNGSRTHVSSVGPGDSFGELALMYSAPRAATVKATSKAVLWAMDRVSFRSLLMATGDARSHQYEGFISRIELFSTLTREEISKLVDAMVPREFSDQDYIIYEGDPGEAFYIVAHGNAAARLRGKELKAYGPGDYFGERALLTNEPRAADVVAVGKCVVLELTGEMFHSLLGSVEELLERNMVEYRRVLEKMGLKHSLSETSNSAPASPSSSPSGVSKILGVVRRSSLKGGGSDAASPSSPRAASTTSAGLPPPVSARTSLSGGPPSLPEGGPSASYLRRRRVSVSAEPVSATLAHSSDKPRTIPKTAEQRDRVMLSTQGNILFSALEPEQLEGVVAAMKERHIKQGTVVIRQGEEGNDFYVVDSGTLDIFVQMGNDCDGPCVHPDFGTKVKTVSQGDSFGELALMYNTPRAASVVCVTDVVLWEMDRLSFRRILMDTMGAKRRMYEAFLDKVELFSGLSKSDKSKLADVLEPQRFFEGDMIIRDGDPGKSFFILEKGSAIARKGLAELKRYGPGDCFGERALMTDEPRAADVVACGDCVVLEMDRSCFNMLLSSAENLLKKNMKEYSKVMEDVGGISEKGSKSAVKSADKWLKQKDQFLQR